MASAQLRGVVPVLSWHVLASRSAWGRMGRIDPPRARVASSRRQRKAFSSSVGTVNDRCPGLAKAAKGGTHRWYTTFLPVAETHLFVWVFCVRRVRGRESLPLRRLLRLVESL